MKSFLVCVLLLTFGAALGEVCLGYPPSVGLDKPCGPSTDCKFGTYCSRAGLCKNRVASGESCYMDDMCPIDHSCQGPTGQMTCVANGNPGATCDNDDETATPRCGGSLSCVNSTCIGGQVGDTCLASSNCIGDLTCVGGLCTPLTDGAECSMDSECSPLSFCDDDKCRPRKTEGQCTSEDECMYGYLCARRGSSDTRQCVPIESREVGEYCDGEDQLCKRSLRCYNNKCAKVKLDICDGDNDCSYGEACTCQGRPLVDGYGKCAANPCTSLFEKLAECVTESCKDSDIDYSGSCLVLNCKTEVDRYLECSSASQIFFSFTLISLFALIASYLGKSI